MTGRLIERRLAGAQTARVFTNGWKITTIRRTSGFAFSVSIVTGRVIGTMAYARTRSSGYD